MSRGAAGEPGKVRSRFGWAALIGVAFASGLLLVGLALLWPPAGKPPEPKGSPFAVPESRLPAGTDNEAASPEKEPMLAIVVGDFGYDPVRDAQWMEFPAKITVSVLPFGPSSQIVAESAQSRGHCVILHVPMEPRSSVVDRTEPFRLRVGMDRKDIAERLARMAHEIPQAVGAMNHMGSAFTTDPASMDAFAEAMRGMGYFFVDGATAPGSLGMEASVKAGVPAVTRDVFFDDAPGPEAMRLQWGKAVALAKSRGGAVLVCHSRSESLSALLELLPGLREAGVRAVTVPELLEGRPPAGGPAREG